MLAVIPARGGSKGIPDKNMQRIRGFTLVQWSVQCALRAGLTAVVSSDSEEILESVAGFAITVRRPDVLSGDDAVTQDAVRHALSYLSCDDDLVVMMQCTTPFTSPARVQECIAMVTNGARWSLTASVFHDFVIANNVVVSPWRWNRRQDMPPRYVISGGAYCYHVEDLLNWQARYYEPFGVVGTDKYEGWNIDDPNDLVIAKVIAREGLAGRWLL